MADPRRAAAEHSEAEVQFQGWYGIHLCSLPHIQALPSVFILGGPGAGKTTIAEMLQATYHVSHIDLSRHFIGAFKNLQSGTDGAFSCFDKYEWEQGVNVPVEIALHCLLSAMSSAVRQIGVEGFVISGYLGSAEFTRKLLRTLDPPPHFVSLESPRLERLDRLLHSPRTDANGVRHDDLKAIGRRNAVYNAHDATILARLKEFDGVYSPAVRSLNGVFNSLAFYISQHVGFRQRVYRLDPRSLADLYLKRSRPAR